MKLIRNTFMVAMVLIVTSIASSQSSSIEEAVAETDASLRYKIQRNGKTIGKHEVLIQNLEGELDFQIQFRVRVKVGFITVYRMDHQSHERWSPDGKLTELEARTKRSGGVYNVSAEPQEDGYHVVVNGEESIAPADMMPSSFTYAADLFEADKTEVTLLDTLSGQQKEAIVTFKGEQLLEVDGFDEQQRVRYFEIYDVNKDIISHKIWMHLDQPEFYRVGLVTKDGHYIEYVRDV